jgi:hypothetical protein
MGKGLKSFSLTAMGVGEFCHIKKFGKIEHVYSK